MASSATKGNCYLCGKELGKTAMKNHLLNEHDEEDGGQDCCLMKVEGAHAKGYWLYIDVPLNSTLSAVDAFLRGIWLECCGHLSCFTWDGREEINPNSKVGRFSSGTRMYHDYDFGSTTTTLITIIGAISRKAHRKPVRLLARNIAPVFPCAACGKTADYICMECVYDSDNPFYCEACYEGHEHDDMMLPVTNSPRMGVCGYEGEMDMYHFVPPVKAGKK